jgi:hypothetical protein
MRWVLMVFLVAIPLLWWQPYVHLSTEAHSPSDGVPVGAVLFMLSPICPPGYSEQPYTLLFDQRDPSTLPPMRLLLCLKGA